MDRIRRFLHNENGGQAMVEFAIAFPIQLFILFGIMQSSLLYVSTLVVNYATFRCARAEIVGEGSTLAEKNGLTGLDTVAQTILAPLAHHNVYPGDSRLVTTFIPGRGTIEGSDVAATKLRVQASEAPGHADVVTVSLEWNQELIFPVVDRLFALIADLGRQDAPDDSAFGTFDTGDSGWRTNPMPTPGDGRGRVRILGGRVHYAIVRSCSLYRGQAYYGLTNSGPEAEP